MEFVKKRILWFSNTKCGYDHLVDGTKNAPATGTWMESIANAFNNNNTYEIGIAFHTKKKEDKVLTRNNITYYPIYIKTSKSKFSRLATKARGKVSWYDELDDYLKVIEDYKPDLIHVFGSEENFGFVASHTNIPVTLSIQGNLTVYEWKYFSGLTFRQLFSGFNLKNFLKFSTAYAKYDLFAKRATREQEIMKNIQHIIGRTDWDKRIAKVLSPDATYYYNDEILRGQFYKEPIVNLELKDTLRVTTMSGPAVYKGLETVCKAISLLNNLNIDFTWSIGGVSESDNLVKAIKKKLGKDFPKKNYHFLGRMNEHQIVDLLRDTNIYVMPSHIENGSIVLSEAMVLGLPVITTLAGGTSSRLTDKKEGLMIQSGDPWSMAGAVIELKDNYDDAIIYGLNARKRALVRHNPDQVIKDLNDIYNQIIAN